MDWYLQPLGYTADQIAAHQSGSDIPACRIATVNDSTQGFSYSQRVTIAIVPRLVAFSVAVTPSNLALRSHCGARRRTCNATSSSGVVFLAPLSYSLCLLLSRAKFKPAVLISRSFDGELIARTIEQLGFLTARGSSTRSGGSGLLALAKAVERGHPAVFTADGPPRPAVQGQARRRETGPANRLSHRHLLRACGKSVAVAVLGSLHDPQAFLPRGVSAGEGISMCPRPATRS